MSNSKSTYLRNAIYNAILRNTTFTGAATLYLSAHTADPALTGINEVVGNGYTRVVITFGAPTSGAGSSIITVTFPAPSPANWGTITHIGIWDSLTSGNFYGGTSLPVPILTAIGIPISILSGNASWTET